MSNLTLATDLGNALIEQGVAIADVNEFAEEWAESLDIWLGSEDAVPAELARRLLETLRNINAMALQDLQFWTVPIDGGVGPDGSPDDPQGFILALLASGDYAVVPGLARIIMDMQTGGGTLDVLLRDNNLSDVPDKAAARANLGITGGGQVGDDVTVRKAADNDPAAFEIEVADATRWRIGNYAAGGDNTMGFWPYTDAGVFTGTPSLEITRNTATFGQPWMRMFGAASFLGKVILATDKATFNPRWSIETGADASGDLTVQNYDPAGAARATPALKITASGTVATFAQRVAVGARGPMLDNTGTNADVILDAAQNYRLRLDWNTGALSYLAAGNSVFTLNTTGLLMAKGGLFVNKAADADQSFIGFMAGGVPRWKWYQYIPVAGRQLMGLFAHTDAGGDFGALFDFQRGATTVTAVDTLVRCYPNFYVGNAALLYLEASTGKGYAQQWASSSDPKLKRDAKVISGGLDALAALKGYTYRLLTSDADPLGFEDAGVMADQLLGTPFERLVTQDRQDGDGNPVPLAVNYAGFWGWAIDAFGEIKTRMDDLEARLARLEGAGRPA